MKINKIYVGVVGSGTAFKEKVVQFLKQSYDVVDVSTLLKDSETVGKKVAQCVLKHEDNYGVVICGNGFGVAKEVMMSENITAAVCINSSQARSAREVNDAKIISLGHKMMTFDVTKDVLTTFVTTTANIYEK